tara:strand:+ start:35 stop:322 length:288 start_codon:yes stop_codon:yes gene_type:complete
MSRFQLRKSVHINLSKSTHSELRILLFKKGLSMQEVIEQFAVSLVEGDDYLNNLLEEIEYNKKVNKSKKQVSSIDAESIFDAIKDGNPLGDKNVE